MPGVGDDVFGLGIASGDPLPDAVILWTRLAPRPTEGGGMPDRDVDVDWQVATDGGFRSLVAAGTTRARAATAHSVHVDARGLDPDRQYYYRFRAGTVLSPVGRTRTAPAPGASPGRLAFALASCQNFQSGYWPAYNAIADDDLDLVVFVGDYIYEYDPSPRFPDRVHTTPRTPGRNQLSTLADYRDRYGQYKADQALREAHAAAPWIAVWDDHEVENNYAGLVDDPGDSGATRQDRAAFARQRAAAYQAWYEHLPVRVDFRAGSPDLRIYRRFGFGDLLTLNMLDTRQYRTPVPGPGGAALAAIEIGRANTTGTMTGAEQERWLYAGLRAARTRWNVIAQQTMMAQFRIKPPGKPTVVNLDQNDGYPAYRARLLSTVRDIGVPNPVVLSGDIHSAWVNDLRVDFDRPETPAVATEFVCTSISSDFASGDDTLVQVDNDLYNPHVRYFRGSQRGYTRCDVTPGSWRSQMRVARTVDRADAPVSTHASWVVEAGRAGAERA